MSSRSRITTFVICAVVFLALVFVARGIARGLAAPLDGLEQFAKARGVVAPEPENEFRESIRNIDWDAPAYASPAPRLRSSSRALPRLALTRALRIEADEPLVALSLRQLAEVEVRAVLVVEPDLETLTSTLNLNDGQKAMVSSLLEWRRWSLDALAEVDGEAESKERINKSFRDAVESMLDANQAQKFQEQGSTTSVGQVLLQAGARTDSNALRFETSTSNTLSLVIQRLLKERK